MKKMLLCSLAISTMAVTSLHAQNSDDPIFNQNYNKPSTTTPFQLKSGVPVNGTTVATCDSGSTTLSYVGCGTGEWFSDPLGNNSLGTGDLTTGMLYNDTSFYIAYQEPASYDTAAPLPPHGSNFSGNVRGYWFQAPVDFYITGITIPTDASSGNISAAIIKFNTGAPPVYSTTTNAFTTLDYWSNVTEDTLYTCHFIAAGEYVGILGNRGDVNSYAGGPFTSNIAGNPVTFDRLGMQYNISTTSPQDVWQEPGGSISRVEILYATGLTYSSTPTEVEVYLPKSTEDTIVMPNLCDGETYYAEGSNQTTSGEYHDTLLNVIGCDSIVHHEITFNPSYDYTIHYDLCNGDSIFLQGAWQTSGGFFYDTLSTMQIGCDSIITTTVFVANNPTASVDPFAQDTICLQSAPISLPSGSPTGGTYSGPGVSGSNFDPSMASLGDVDVIYTVTNTYNCSDSDTATIHVIDCTTLGEEGIEGLHIFPNPTQGNLNINFDFNPSSHINIRLYDNQGKLIEQQTVKNAFNQINLQNLADGIYVLHVNYEGSLSRIKITKQ